MSNIFTSYTLRYTMVYRIPCARASSVVSQKCGGTLIRWLDWRLFNQSSSFRHYRSAAVLPFLWCEVRVRGSLPARDSLPPPTENRKVLVKVSPRDSCACVKRSKATLSMIATEISTTHDAIRRTNLFGCFGRVWRVMMCPSHQSDT